MKAWKITAPRTFEPYEAPGEKVGEGCVKIKVSNYLLSKPDLQTYLGIADVQYPIIPGASCCGMVIDAGEGVAFKRGDRVYVHPQRYCGECSACRAGRYSECENIGYYGSTCDGFLRDFAIVRADNCLPIPERIANEEAVFLDYISIAAQTVNAMNVAKGDFIAISGATTLGIILGQVALYYQTVPILIDENEKSLEMATNLGIYYTVDASKNDPLSKISHITGGKMADSATHIASGNIPISQTIHFIRRDGTMTVIGRHSCVDRLDCSLLPVLRNNISVIGITNGAKHTQAAVNMLANKSVSVLPFIAGTVGYEDIPSLFEVNSALKSTPLKTMVKIS